MVMEEEEEEEDKGQKELGFTFNTRKEKRNYLYAIKEGEWKL